MGHVGKVVILTGNIEAVRVKEAQNLFRQFENGGYVAKGEVFDASVVDFSDITEESTFYGGLRFVPLFSCHLAKYGRMTTTADAAHCQGIGP